MNKFLSLNETNVSMKNFLVLMLLAFVFSVSVRYIWVENFKAYDQFQWNNELMINTNDGYVFAEGARDRLQGFHEDNDLSYYDSSLSTLTALLAKIIPVSFETLILWMPAIFGSFLIIPIMLIARVLNQEYIGFIASLLAGIAWSYYNRTMIGYYDTDMLVIVLPTFILWSIIFNVDEEKNRYLPLVPIFIVITMWWYPQSYSLIMAMGVMMFVYTVVFARKNSFYYKILIYMLLSVVAVSLWIKAVLVLGLFLLFHYKKELFSLKIILILLGLSIALVLLSGGFTPILNQLNGYVFRESVTNNINDIIKLNYFAVTQTVREAGQIPFETFANRISGNTATFVLATLGYILLSLRYRVMWLALPMAGLGFLALKGGLRFTVYAVPIMAFGIAYLILLSSKLFEAFIFNDKTLKIFQLGFISLATIAILYPNVKHIQGYLVPTVFNKQEVQVLDELGKKAAREDYVISWWDYGYPIRYYSDVKTLVDGGKHTGKDNFAVSYTLLNNQISAANMARLEVEYTEKQFYDKFNSNLLEMMKDNNETDVDSFVSSLYTKNFSLPKRTRDIYLYLPNRMLNILPTIDLFSNLDLKTGSSKARPFFYLARNMQQTKEGVNLGNGIKLINGEGDIQIGQNRMKINNFVVTEYDKQGLSLIHI